MSKWENQVKVSLDDIFDDDTKTDEPKKTYSDKSDSEIEELHEEVTEEEDIHEETVYYSSDEQLALDAKGIHLNDAREYHLDTTKKPIWNGKVTNKFKKWLSEKQQSNEIVISTSSMNKEELQMYELLLDEWEEEEKGRFELRVMIEEQIQKYECDLQEALYSIINGLNLDEKLKKLHSKKRKLLTPKDIKRKIAKNTEERTYKAALSWLYKFMEKFTFDFTPSEDDMKHIEKIDELIKD